MSTLSAPASAHPDGGMVEFERTTSRWGRITMIAGLILSLAGPLYLLLFADLDVSATQLWTAFGAVAATFFVIWLVEPLTYFPILGSASMYQAFMIGNISNKLLPAALVAQSTVGAKPGTPRGSLVAVMAICGAAAVHLVSLLILVGLLGTWLISVVPPEMLQTVRVYVLPSVMGAVVVQAIVSLKQVRPTLIAFAVALTVQFVLVPAVPQLAMVATALAVVTTLVLAWFARDRRSTGPDSTDPQTDAAAPADSIHP